jgi:hypothetical protein
MSDDTTLIEAVDEAAKELLRRAKEDSNLPAEKRISITEQVKAFDAVVAWLERRESVVPKQRVESRISVLRSAVNGGETRRRRTPAEDPPPIDPPPLESA